MTHIRRGGVHSINTIPFGSLYKPIATVWSQERVFASILVHMRPTRCLEKGSFICLEKGPTRCLAKGPTCCLAKGPTSCLAKRPTSCLAKRPIQGKTASKIERGQVPVEQAELEGDPGGPAERPLEEAGVRQVYKPSLHNINRTFFGQ